MDEYSSFVDALDSFSISSLSSKFQFRSAADSMTTNKIPKLRFHGRSLSAKDPPILDQQNECAVDVPRQPRLLPNIPDRAYSNLEPRDEERLFVRSAIRSSCSLLSPSEERIRRNQELQFVKSDSTPKLVSGRVLPSVSSGMNSSKSLSSRSSPGGIRKISENLPPQASKHSSSRRLDFRRAHQCSMGQIDSRPNNSHPARDKLSAFSSFDATSGPTTNLTKKTKPIRFDSTASEDSVCTEPSDDKSGFFGSSGSLDHCVRGSVKQTKKRSVDNRPMQRSQRSSSNSKNSLTMKAPISPPKVSSSKKVPPISSSSQAIILYCMENARGDIASRVLARMAHKREDFSTFCTNMNPEQWNDFVGSLRTYLNEVVSHIQSAEKIREISMYFGMNQVPRRNVGFKADYFSVMANALTTECVFLDGAAHQPTEAIEAWAELVELMFSNVRDGYYQQIRYLRRNSQCFNAMFSQSSDQSTDGSDLLTAPSTTGVLIRQCSEMSISQSTNQVQPQRASPIPPKFC